MASKTMIVSNKKMTFSDRGENSRFAPREQQKTMKAKQAEVTIRRTEITIETVSVTRIKRDFFADEVAAHAAPDDDAIVTQADCLNGSTPEEKDR